MTLFAFLITLAVMAAVGKALLRSAGWPTSPDAALRWVISLFVLAVMFSSLPAVVASLLGSFAASVSLPQVGLPELMALLLVSGLAVVGYVGWTRGEVERLRGAEREAAEHRERLLPPAPLPEEPPLMASPSKVDDPATPVSDVGPIFQPRPPRAPRRRNDRGMS